MKILIVKILLFSFIYLPFSESIYSLDTLMQEIPEIQVETISEKDNENKSNQKLSSEWTSSSRQIYGLILTLGPIDLSPLFKPEQGYPSINEPPPESILAI